jgi:uroporphyrin-3 C-methyltransferase/uroporphyrinogen III methyltransferase/synthase
MNELPTLPEPLPDPAAAPAGQAIPTAPASPPPAGPSTRTLTIAVVVLGILLAAQAVNSHTQMRKLRTEMAQRLQKGDTLNGETNQIAKAVQEATKELQVKVGVLEGRQQEAQAQ